MPKLKKNKLDTRLDAYRCMTGRISGCRVLISDEEMGKTINKTRNTIQNWRRNCSKMKMEDLWKLQDKYHFTDEEILYFIKGE